MPENREQLEHIYYQYRRETVVHRRNRCIQREAGRHHWELLNRAFARLKDICLPCHAHESGLNRSPAPLQVHCEVDLSVCLCVSEEQSQTQNQKCGKFHTFPYHDR